MLFTGPSPMELVKQVGQNVRRYRLDAGMNIPKLAAMVGCSHQPIRNIEVGRNAPSLSTLEKIAGALAITPAYLVVDPSVHNLLERNLFAQALQVALTELRQSHQNQLMVDAKEFVDDLG